MNSRTSFECIDPLVSPEAAFAADEAVDLFRSELYPEDDPFYIHEMVFGDEVRPQLVCYGLFTAEPERKLVAAALLHTRAAKASALIVWLAVKRQYQGQGYGRKMVRNLEAVAAGTGARTIEAEPLDGSVAGFYERCFYRLENRDTETVYVKSIQPEVAG